MNLRVIGSECVTLSNDFTLSLWDLETRTLTYEVNLGSVAEPAVLEIYRDYIITVASDSKGLIAFNLNTLKVESVPLPLADLKKITNLVISSEGELYTAHKDGILRHWVAPFDNEGEPMKLEYQLSDSYTSWKVEGGWLFGKLDNDSRIRVNSLHAEDTTELYSNECVGPYLVHNNRLYTTVFGGIGVWDLVMYGEEYEWEGGTPIRGSFVDLEVRDELLIGADIYGYIRVFELDSFTNISHPDLRFLPIIEGEVGFEIVGYGISETGKFVAVDSMQSQISILDFSKEPSSSEESQPSEELQPAE